MADPLTATPVDPGTLFWAGSTAKGVAASLAHVLVERGDLTDDMRIVDVWPEFGAATCCCTADVPGLPPDTTAAELCDWDRMCAVIADSEPWWEPGTRFGYHAKTFGFLLGETLRRATGNTIPSLLREHLTDPLGVGDEVHLGVPEPLLQLP